MLNFSVKKNLSNNVFSICLYNIIDIVLLLRCVLKNQKRK